MHLPRKITDVARFATPDEGVRLGGAAPFIAVGAGQLAFRGAHEPELVLATLRGNPHSLYGYDRSDTEIEMPADEVFEAWRHGSLAINLLDAPLPALAAILPAETRALLGTRTVSPVLTKAGGYTALHVDPPAHGGGWMFLACGEKEWLILDPQYIAVVADAQPGELCDMPTEDLCARVPEGALQRCRLVGGEFLYFPPGWPHRVHTLRDSVGVGGYLDRSV